MNRKTLRSIVCSVLIVLYIAGLFCMFMGQPGAGISLWVISTVGGLVVLFHIQNRDAKDEAARKAKDGEDKPCE